MQTILNRKLLAFLIPVVLLCVLDAVRWQTWQRDNPPMTALDTRVRKVLADASNMQFGIGGHLLSPTEKQDFIDHIWIATSPRQSQFQIPFNKKEFAEWRFSLTPGQGQIVLCKDPAFDFLLFTHWSGEPHLGGSPPIVTSETFYELHPATSRYLRAAFHVD